MKFAANKKAYHEYYILDKLEAGIELKGTEVKSVKEGKTSIKESYIRIKGNEIFIINMHINSYKYGNINNVDELRDRRLLLHKQQIKKLYSKVKQDGLTLLPLTVYSKSGLVKIEIALAKGKKLHDKRSVMATKTQKREVERAIKERR